MKTMTAFAATLAAGMALAPMTASAATITFDASPGGQVAYGGGGDALSGSFALNRIRGQDTPRNAGESRACDPQCGAVFQTGANLSFGGIPGGYGYDYEWKGGGLLEISQRDPTSETRTTLLAGTFVEPVTATIRSRSNPPNPPANFGYLDVAGVLKDVVIHDDLAAFYGVPNWGTGEIRIETSGYGAVLPNEDFQLGLGSPFQGTVTFSPVPIPAALPLMLTALAGLSVIRLRRMHAA